MDLAAISLVSISDGEKSYGLATITYMEDAGDSEAHVTVVPHPVTDDQMLRILEIVREN